MSSYLIIGDSLFLIKEEIKKINKNGYIEEKYDLNEDSLESIIESASYLTLFEEKKAIIIQNANIFNNINLEEKNFKKLVAFLENTDNIIVFITHKTDSKKRIVKYFEEKKKIILIKKYYDNDLIKIIISKEKEIGNTISYKSAEYITRSCLSNYDLIMKELEKINIFYNSNTIIKDDEIINIVSKTLNDSVFAFTNMVIEKKKNLSFKLFDDLLLFNIDVISLIAILSVQYRHMYKIKYYMEKNYKQNDLCKEIGLKGYALTKTIENSYNYSMEELKNKLLVLSKIDILIKSGSGNKEILFNNFLLNI